MATAAAVATLVFGLQSIGAALGQMSLVPGHWFTIGLVGVFGSLIAAVVTGFLRRGQRIAFGVMAVMWLACVISWAFVAHPVASFADRPWLWQLTNVAAVGAVLAFPFWLGLVYSVVAPIAMSILTALPNGGGMPPDQALLDACNMLILAIVVVVIVAMLRRAGDEVDRTQASAMLRFADLARQHATERERVRVDGLLHDSVLASLLAAARATSPDEKAAVVQLASDALTKLQDYGTNTVALTAEDGQVTVLQLLEQLSALSAKHDASWEIAAEHTPALVPLEVAEAMTQAVEQALVNSVLHGGADATRTVRVATESTDEHLVIEVVDTGIGFDVHSIAAGRLGLRISILERMRVVGGWAMVDSEPGQGTTVVVAWPASVELTADAVEEGHALTSRRSADPAEPLHDAAAAEQEQQR